MSVLFDVSSSGTDLSIVVAVWAGIVSFLSPCVLPLVPAYLGQLTAVAVVGREAGAEPSRWVALRHAATYVAGFGVVFTLLGITATFAGGGLFRVLPQLRQLGGIVLIVMGLSLAGILRIGVLDRMWRPLQAGGSAALATTTGTLAFASPGTGPEPSRLDRLGGAWSAGGAATRPRSGSARSSRSAGRPALASPSARS